ncbi:hypothetical protein ACOSP7_000715 [Xanthoceras sorbifolium]|uniref:Uncharacterized protein n=1 Tax=Xanthoceras sorbifolium TaxID=99658 RepID=A0ABQ8IPQ9_9ROSI|nr:hypothetical protein JRO89_XS01G0343900 [Xanthoceras sorbifolium]
MSSSAEARSIEEKEESFAYAMQLVNGAVLPMTLQAAIELGVFDIIAKAGPDAKLSASEIASQMPSRNKEAPLMLDRMLRLLASHSIVDCSVVDLERFYSLTSVSGYFVSDQDGVSLGPLMTLLQDKIFLDSWSQLKDAVLEGGIPFDRVHGTHAFEYPGLDPRFNQVFNKAMYNHTTIVIKNIIEVYRGFENVKQLVDVGGSLGVTLRAVTAKYSYIKGINFDLPHVIQHAPQYPGVEHVGGDMFESVPKGDAIFMKWILHDWSDEHCMKLLKNCYKSIPDDGKVIVVEAILPVSPETNAATKATSQIDVLMMTQNPGGKERTRHEFMALATGAGFSGIRFECFASNFCVMEFYK